MTSEILPEKSNTNTHVLLLLLHSTNELNVHNRLALPVIRVVQFMSFIRSASKLEEIAYLRNRKKNSLEKSCFFYVPKSLHQRDHSMHFFSNTQNRITRKWMIIIMHWTKIAQRNLSLAHSTKAIKISRWEEHAAFLKNKKDFHNKTA